MKFMNRLSAALAIALLPALLFAPLLSRAQQNLPTDVVAMLTLKVLTFDRNLADRAGGEVVVGIVYSDSDLAHAGELQKSFDTYKGKKVNGLGIRTATHLYSDPATLKAWLASENVCVVFLTPGLLSKASAIHGAAAEEKCLTAGGSGEFPEKGTALGFEIADGKPRIVIHLERSKAEGVDFAAGLLQMARVIK